MLRPLTTSPAFLISKTDSCLQPELVLDSKLRRRSVRLVASILREKALMKTKQHLFTLGLWAESRDGAVTDLNEEAAEPCRSRLPR